MRRPAAGRPAGHPRPRQPRALRTPRPEGATGLVSILIPARDEAGNIGDALAAALASRGVPVEILVMDDGSTDATAEIVRAHADEDPRVRLLTAPPLPPGWAGKNHACQRLAEAAQGPWLLFIDADVRLAPRRGRGARRRTPAGTASPSSAACRARRCAAWASC